MKQDNGYCSYYKCILETELDREKLYKHCSKNGISLTGEVYRTPVHLQPLYKPKFGHLKLPNTENFCRIIFVHPYILNFLSKK